MLWHKFSDTVELMPIAVLKFASLGSNLGITCDTRKRGHKLAIIVLVHRNVGPKHKIINVRA